MSATCVPLYDSLGENAIEYIINHAETMVAFVQVCVPYHTPNARGGPSGGALTCADQAAPQARRDRLRRTPDRLRRRLRRHLRRPPPPEAHPDRLRRYDRLDWRASGIGIVVGLLVVLGRYTR
jgi:hypothetical protein